MKNSDFAKHDIYSIVCITLQSVVSKNTAIKIYEAGEEHKWK